MMGPQPMRCAGPRPRRRARWCLPSAAAQQDWAQGLQGRRRGVQEGRQRRAGRAEADRGARSPAGAEAVAQGELLLGRLSAVHPRLLPRPDRGAQRPLRPGAAAARERARQQAGHRGRQGRVRAGTVQPAEGPRRSGQSAAGDQHPADQPGPTPERPPEKPPAEAAREAADEHAIPPTDTPPNNTVTPPPPNPPPPTNVEPAWLARSGGRWRRRAASLQSGPLRRGAQQPAPRAAAPATASAAPTASCSGREIDAAQDRRGAADRRPRAPAHRPQGRRGRGDAGRRRWRRCRRSTSALPALRSDISSSTAGLQGAAALAQVERTGVKLFLSGELQAGGRADWRRPSTRGITSPRVYLFLASSRAAQALLAPQGRASGAGRRGPQVLRAGQAGRGALAERPALHLTQHPRAAERQLTARAAAPGRRGRRITPQKRRTAETENVLTVSERSKPTSNCAFSNTMPAPPV